MGFTEKSLCPFGTPSIEAPNTIHNLTILNGNVNDESVEKVETV